jgi:hypothetical protein
MLRDLLGFLEVGRNRSSSYSIPPQKIDVMATNYLEANATIGIIKIKCPEIKCLEIKCLEIKCLEIKCLRIMREE